MGLSVVGVNYTLFASEIARNYSRNFYRTGTRMRWEIGSQRFTEVLEIICEFHVTWFVISARERSLQPSRAINWKKNLINEQSMSPSPNPPEDRKDSKLTWTQKGRALSTMHWKFLNNRITWAKKKMGKKKRKRVVANIVSVCAVRFWSLQRKYIE